MLKLKHVTARARVHPSIIFHSSFSSSSTCSPSSSSSSSSPPPPPSSLRLVPGSPSHVSLSSISSFQAVQVAESFKEWFKSRNNDLLNRIYTILSAHSEENPSSRLATDAALAQLRLSEAFVLEVLYYGKDVLSCIKFFHWAGRQHGFHHTPATFRAMFKIMSRAKLKTLILDFVDGYVKTPDMHKIHFHNILVMGYAIAGEPEIALQMFGKMRFKGLDLDALSYQVLFNALVEESWFDAARFVFQQIAQRGLASKATHSIMVKSLCKQNQLEEAEVYVRWMIARGKGASGSMVGHLVDALCKKSKFMEAGRLIEEFRKVGTIDMKECYGMWIRNLLQAGKVDGALEVLKRDMMASEGAVPDVFRCNWLVCRLLREDRLVELWDLLTEMMEHQIMPDNVTMNAVLCFFCKAGMLDIAIELYKSKSEYRLSPNALAYNYLINTLCGDGSIDEAYVLLRDSFDQGWLPGQRAFSILAGALCREGKFDKMKELLVVALDKNFMPHASVYDKFIRALCEARRLDDGYSLHNDLNKTNKVASDRTYFKLISGFSKSCRGDIATKLLIEMQDKGLKPSHRFVKGAITCVCDMENPEQWFCDLLSLQISQNGHTPEVYNSFIFGAGQAKKPELAGRVFEMMRQSGIEPNVTSNILMLKSYLKSERFSHALNFFEDLSKKRVITKKMYEAMVVGLCKAGRPDLALEKLQEMKDNKLSPTLDCYEELIKILCSNKSYNKAIDLVAELDKSKRSVPSFLGNVLLLHSMKGEELYKNWRESIYLQNEGSPRIKVLGSLIGVFSGGLSLHKHIDVLEEAVEQCFPLDLYTYNMLLRKLTECETMNYACQMFVKLQRKGYQPNRWTYHILAYGFYKRGNVAEAHRWVKEMLRRGFKPLGRIEEFLCIEEEKYVKKTQSAY